MRHRISLGQVRPPTLFLFLPVILLIAACPAQIGAQSRTRRTKARPAPTSSSPTKPAPPPADPEELTVESASAILPRLRTCLTHNRPTQDMDVQDGEYPSSIMFYDNIDKYKYLERRGWIRTQTIDRKIYIFFTPEADRLFFSGATPEWASVETPSEEERRRGYHRRRLRVTLARLEMMRVVDVTPGITPDLNRKYTITAVWRWKATAGGEESPRPRLYHVVFHWQRINGFWEMMTGVGPGCSTEAPYYGRLPD